MLNFEHVYIYMLYYVHTSNTMLATMLYMYVEIVTHFTYALPVLS